MITITRKLAVINGFVEIPNSRIQSKTAVTTEEVLAAIPNSKRTQLTNNGLRPRHNMKFIELPVFDRTEGYPEDWFKTLNGLV
jgi:hypothetical protein